MNKDLELWQFIHKRLARGRRVMALIVADSSGSSPGRAGYKMAVADDGEICGSIGGGVMEVNLVGQSLELLSEPRAATGLQPLVIEQVHQKTSPYASGLICSGRQTVILVSLAQKDSQAIETIIDAVESGKTTYLNISRSGITVRAEGERGFHRESDTEFTYAESLGRRDELYIIGGGHCSLALSELMSKLDFRVTIFDDRPELNTIEKNRFTDETRIIESYQNVGELVPSGLNVYVVVMTLGYASDETAIRSMIEKNVRYFGVLGSRAKISVLFRSLKDDGFPPEYLDRIRAPIGLPINSRTPEEIAVSIAAEIISIRNAA